MGCCCSKPKNKDISRDRPSLNKLSIEPATFLVQKKGKLSDDYTIIKELGSGAFAEVHLYDYKPLNQKRAVKLIHKAGLHSQQMDEKDKLKEISVLKKLDHPNILRCYDIFEDSWKFYVAMDYCEGGELFEKILDMKQFTEVQAAEIIFQILSAVAYCHSNKVIHRDLKPENILLKDSEAGFNIKVADFGSSCFIDPKRNLSGCFGSAYYIAPEVLQGPYNEKCDIWSVGIIMYILLTGRPPYKGSDEKHIMEQVRLNPILIDPTSLSYLSTDSVDLLQKLLTVDKSIRISAKEALDHSWIKTYRTKHESSDLSHTLTDLASFTSSSKLKNAVHIFLASQAISHEENKKLKQEFIELDKNGDGKISRDELIEQYIKTMDKDKADEVVNKILAEVDLNNSGDIDYTEFLAACMDISSYNSKKNLEVAFQVFDKDGNGIITVEEIKSVLGSGQLVDGAVWSQIIQEADRNGDGMIDLKEFYLLMNRRFESRMG